MKVLIGIISKNRAKILPKAIESAMLQDYVDKRIAVFDDGSTDDTKDLSGRFPNVEWIFSPKSLGVAEARNQLMKSTDADFFFSLDDDAWFLEHDAISAGVEYLKLNEKTGAIAYDVLSPDRNKKKSRSTPYPVNTFIGCAHLLNLKYARQIGFYATNPGFYGGEEKDMSIRLQDNGYPIIYMTGFHVWHDKTLISRDLPRQHRSGVCNDLVFAYRRISFPLLLIAFPGKIFNHLRFSIRTNLLKACLLGMGDFVKAFPVVMKTRKPVKNSTFHKFQKLSQR